MSIQSKKKIERRLSGVVVSDKMDKTIVVQVAHTKRYPKYSKIYKMYKNYKVHDPKNAHKAGETVTIVSCRPISRGKRWKVVGAKEA